MNTETSATLNPPRLLCVFAHPDDEVFCAGGTIAKYVASQAEVMVVSATRGDAGQIRDAKLATRRTLGKVRESELYESCRRLGAQHAVCLDYGDGTLKDIDLTILVERVTRIIREFKPDIVITFGPDGGYGHPDHIAISAVTSAACMVAGDASQFPMQVDSGLAAHEPHYLYYAYFPRKPILMLDSLSKWLVESGGGSGIEQQASNVTDFVRALMVFAEETTLLQYSSDRMDVAWYPSGFYIIEQGETARDLYLILSGVAQAVREHDDETLEPLKDLGPGHFFGEVALAKRTVRTAHVVAKTDVTCLILSNAEAVNFSGRGSKATITGGTDRVTLDESLDSLTQSFGYTNAIDVTDYIYKKVSAMAAHRTQYPISPDIFPLYILSELMGHEYFVRVLPRPVIEHTLFPTSVNI
jgi:LmbE family N-acetylglucosaminyl deacetylase